MVWECQACGYVHETTESQLKQPPQFSGKSSDLTEWVCPICGVGTEFQEEVICKND